MEGARETTTELVFDHIDASDLDRKAEAVAMIVEKEKELQHAYKKKNRDLAATLVTDLKRLREEAYGGGAEVYGKFDRRGVLYHIGTRGGTEEWANPHIAERVICSRSSDGKHPDGRQSSAGGLVSAFVSNPHGPVGSCSTAQWPGQWLEVDLGPTRRLVLKHYS